MAFWDKLLNWLGYGQEEDNDEDKGNETELQSPTGSRGKLISLPSKRANTKFVISRPQSFGQVVKLTDNLKNFCPLIINLELLPVDEARRVVDFLSGAAYALNGQVYKITGGIFLFASSNIDMSTDMKEEIPADINWLEITGR